jgi:hypothetical protein
MSTVNLFAECFSPSDVHEPFTISPCLNIWRTWMEENPEATRLFLRIYHPEHVDDLNTFMVPIGDPVRGGENENAIYLPTWMIDANKYQGAGEEAIVEIVDASSLPRATRIVLRPVDSALHEVDVVSVFEKYFSRLGVLQEGKLYLVPLEELGGFHVSVYVEKLEPAAEVYLDGDEVPLEFERAVDYVEPPPRPPTPIPAVPALLVPGHPDLMVPANFLGDPPGADLSGAYSSRPNAVGGGQGLRRNQTYHPPGFIPFSGKGHSLNGK